MTRIPKPQQFPPITFRQWLIDDGQSAVDQPACRGVELRGTSSLWCCLLYLPPISGRLCAVESESMSALEPKDAHAYVQKLLGHARGPWLLGVDKYGVLRELKACETPHERSPCNWGELDGARWQGELMRIAFKLNPDYTHTPWELLDWARQTFSPLYARRAVDCYRQDALGRARAYGSGRGIRLDRVIRDFLRPHLDVQILTELYRATGHLSGDVLAWVNVRPDHQARRLALLPLHAFVLSVLCEDASGLRYLQALGDIVDADPDVWLAQLFACPPSTLRIVRELGRASMRQLRIAPPLLSGLHMLIAMISALPAELIPGQGIYPASHDNVRALFCLAELCSIAERGLWRIGPDMSAEEGFCPAAHRDLESRRQTKGFLATIHWLKTFLLHPAHQSEQSQSHAWAGLLKMCTGGEDLLTTCVVLKAFIETRPADVRVQGCGLCEWTALPDLLQAAWRYEGRLPQRPASEQAP